MGATKKCDKVIVQTDGSSRGNPGPAAIGVVISSEDGEVIVETAEPIGETTNNVAEYHALIRGLEMAQELGAREVAVWLDSELLVEQMRGGYRIKSPQLMPLAIHTRNLLNSFAKADINHAPRGLNRRADQLAASVLTRKCDPVRKSTSHGSSQQMQHFLAVCCIEGITPRQIRELAKRLTEDEQVRVARVLIDKTGEKMACELYATSEEAVFQFAERHGINLKWLMRVQTDQRA